MGNKEMHGALLAQEADGRRTVIHWHGRQEVADARQLDLDSDYRVIGRTPWDAQRLVLHLQQRVQGAQCGAWCTQVLEECGVPLTEDREATVLCRVFVYSESVTSMLQ